MSTAGYYKANPRALSLRGLARMRGPLALPLALLITRFKKPAPAGWMPALWKDLECRKEDLCERFWRATARHREDFATLGFFELGLKKVKDFLDPVIRDNGGINYLHTSRAYFAQLVYNRAYVSAPIPTERERISIAFTAVFKQQVISYTNSRNPFDSIPRYETVRLPSKDVPSLYRRFTEHLKRRAETPDHFPDDDSVRRWFDSSQLEVFEHRVRIGLFIKMTDAEVEAARRKLPPPLPNP
jgi:hypothetical protein